MSAWPNQGARVKKHLAFGARCRKGELMTDPNGALFYVAGAVAVLAILLLVVWLLRER